MKTFKPNDTVLWISDKGYTSPCGQRAEVYAVDLITRRAAINTQIDGDVFSYSVSFDELAHMAQGDLSTNVKGYEIRTFDTELNVTLSTLYAVLADGKILESDTHPIDSIFSRPCRVWTAVSKLPDEAEYIGDYPAVHATPR